MKATSLLLLLILSPAWAVTVHAPETDSEKSALRRAQDDFAQLKKIDDRISALDQQFERSFSDKHVVPSQKDIQDHQSDIAAERAKKSVFCNDAIFQVTTAFGIGPINPTASISRSGGFYQTGKPAHWQPIFGDITDHRIRGSANTIAPPPSPDPTTGAPPAAVTWADGLIEIGIGSFSRDPNFLAAILVHETTHFEQDTDPAYAKDIPYFDESAAYRLTLKPEIVSALGLDADDVRAIEKARDSALKRIQNNGGQEFVAAPASKDDEENPEKTKIEGQADFDEFLTQATPTGREIASRLATDDLAHQMAHIAIDEGRDPAYDRFGPLTKEEAQQEISMMHEEEVWRSLMSYAYEVCDRANGGMFGPAPNYDQQFHFQPATTRQIQRLLADRSKWNTDVYRVCQRDLIEAVQKSFGTMSDTDANAIAEHSVQEYRALNAKPIPPSYEPAAPKKIRKPRSARPRTYHVSNPSSGGSERDPSPGSETHLPVNEHGPALGQLRGLQ